MATDDSVRVEFECCWSKLVQLVGTGRGGAAGLNRPRAGRARRADQSGRWALVLAGVVGFLRSRMLAPRRAEAATPAAEKTAAEAGPLREIEDQGRAEIWRCSKAWSVRIGRPEPQSGLQDRLKGSVCLLYREALALRLAAHGQSPDYPRIGYRWRRGTL
jgi:hypothetical protein